MDHEIDLETITLNCDDIIGNGALCREGQHGGLTLIGISEELSYKNKFNN